MNVPRETAADPPGAHIHDTSSAPPSRSQFPPSPFQISHPPSKFRNLMY